jgi:phosphate transport system permease protein
MSVTDRMVGMSARNETQEAVRRALQGQRDRGSVVFEAFLISSLLIALGVLVWLLVDIFARSMPVWETRGVGDFLGRNLSSNPERAGIAQALTGSLILIVITGIIAIPTGIAAAVYLEEYARDSAVTRTLNTVVRNLAGVPAVVYGILGLAVFVIVLEPITGGRTLLAGGLTLAVVVLPIVIITAAEALRAVPASIREAGYGVGATKWEVTRSHVIPYAAPGILTGVILTLARAFGETAPLLLIGAAASSFSSPGNATIIERLTGPYTALPTVIFGWARQPQQEFKALTAAAIVVLLVVILVINAIAIILRNRYARRW